MEATIVYSTLREEVETITAADPEERRNEGW